MFRFLARFRKEIKPEVRWVENTPDTPRANSTSFGISSPDRALQPADPPSITGSAYSGLFRYHNLVDWWKSEFSKDERAYAEAKLDPSGEGKLFAGDIVSSSATASQFLVGLVTWFTTKKDARIAVRIIEKAKLLAVESGDPQSEHFAAASEAKIYYKLRDELPGALEKAIAACEAQIAMADKASRAMRKAWPNSPLPTHYGYEQLAIILDKQGRTDEALRLSLQAKKQGWWQGRIHELNSRIDRYEKKLAKTKKRNT